MKRAEEVTFGGGGGLDRKGQLREDPAALDAAWSTAGTLVLMTWRGKVLSQRSGPDRGPDGLAWIASNHPLAEEHRRAALYLGMAPDGTERFACDLGAWQPDALDEMALASFADLSEQQHPELPAGYVFAELRRIMARLCPLEAELAATAKALLSWHQSHRVCRREC